MIIKLTILFTPKFLKVRQQAETITEYREELARWEEDNCDDDNDYNDDGDYGDNDGDGDEGDVGLDLLSSGWKKASGLEARVAQYLTTGSSILFSVPPPARTFWLLFCFDQSLQETRETRPRQPTKD